MSMNTTTFSLKHFSHSKKRASKKNVVYYPSLPTVERKLGVWRTKIINQKKVLFYVSLEGNMISKPQCFGVAKSDKFYLQSLEIKDAGYESSLIHHYRTMSPFCDVWVRDITNFRYWYLPSSVIQYVSGAYQLIGVLSLFQWQSECLLKALGSQEPDISSNTTVIRNGVRDAHLSEITCKKEWDGSETLDHYSTSTKSKSILYGAPTSGGKSLVAEIIMLRAALFQGRRSLLVLPHVALCEEKVAHLRTVFGPNSVCLRIEGFHSNEGSSATWHPGIDIAVCTIEKANAIINRLILELTDEIVFKHEYPTGKKELSPNETLGKIGVIVIDELHLIGDSQRGFLLELFLTKIQRLSSLLHGNSAMTFDIQVVGLSATLPNLNQIGDWLNAETYETSVRPLPLDLFYKIGNKLMRVTGRGTTELHKELPSSQLCRLDTHTLARSTMKDPDHLGYLVWDCFRRREQCLVFCATKEWCQKACRFLARILPFYQSKDKIFLDQEISVTPEENYDADMQNVDPILQETDKVARITLLENLRQSASHTTPLNDILSESILEGVAYHHAGMTVEERSLIEESYRLGNLLVLCATSTLAVGVNLPVCRVIFRSTQIGRDTLDATRFRQMAGRAGRIGFDVRGEAIAICANDYDAARTAKLFTDPVESVRSVLWGMRLTRLILELFVLRLANTVQNCIAAILNHSLLAYQINHLNFDDRVVATKRLYCHLNRGLQYLMCNAMLWLHHPISSLESQFISSLEKETTSISLPTDLLLDPSNSLNLYENKQSELVLNEKENSSAKEILLNCHSNKQNKTVSFPRVHPLQSLVILTQFFNTTESSLQRLSHQFLTAYFSFRHIRYNEHSTGLLHNQGQTKPKSESSIPMELNFMPVLSTCSGHSQAQTIGFFFNEETTSDWYCSDDDILIPTPIGVAIIETSITLPEGLEFFADLYRTRLQGCLLTSELHFLVLISPLSYGSDIPELTDDILPLLNNLNRRSNVVAEFFGIDTHSTHQCLREINSSHYTDCNTIHEQWISGTLKYEAFSMYHKIQNYRRFLNGLILYDLLHEAPLPAICHRFHLRSGTIQSIKARGVFLAGLLSVFCTKLGWPDIANLLKRLGTKLHETYATTADLELGQISFIQGKTASALISARFKTIEDIAHAPITAIIQALNTLYRDEVPAGDESREFLRRQNRRKTELALKISTSAQQLLEKKLQAIDDEVSLANCF